MEEVFTTPAYGVRFAEFLFNTNPENNFHSKSYTLTQIPFKQFVQCVKITRFCDSAHLPQCN